MDINGPFDVFRRSRPHILTRAEVLHALSVGSYRSSAALGGFSGSFDRLQITKLPSEISNPTAHTVQSTVYHKTHEEIAREVLSEMRKSAQQNTFANVTWTPNKPAEHRPLGVIYAHLDQVRNSLTRSIASRVSGPPSTQPVPVSALAPWIADADSGWSFLEHSAAHYTLGPREGVHSPQTLDGFSLASSNLDSDHEQRLVKPTSNEDDAASIASSSTAKLSLSIDAIGELIQRGTMSAAHTAETKDAPPCKV